MTKKIYWLCDLIGITGSTLLLYGIYLAWSLSMVLMIGGLLMIAYASRLSWCLKRHDPR